MFSYFDCNCHLVKEHFGHGLLQLSNADNSVEQLTTFHPEITHISNPFHEGDNSTFNCFGLIMQSDCSAKYSQLQHNEQSVWRVNHVVDFYDARLKCERIIFISDQTSFSPTTNIVVVWVRTCSRLYREKTDHTTVFQFQRATTTLTCFKDFRIWTSRMTSAFVFCKEIVHSHLNTTTCQTQDKSHTDEKKTHHLMLSSNCELLLLYNLDSDFFTGALLKRQLHFATRAPETKTRGLLRV